MESSSTVGHDFTRHSGAQLLGKDVSLVEKMRPTSIAEYVGQERIIGPGTVLNHLLEKRVIPSMILWGPHGCGKTSLSNVITCLVKEAADDSVHVVSLSAADASVKSVRNVVAESKSERKTIVLMDEIHRFNKLQQDIFLPHVEAGTFTLIGCTTENPSYSLNSALLSRCRLFVLNKLTECNVREILRRAIEFTNGSVLDAQRERETSDGEQIETYPRFYIAGDAIRWLAEACDGDASVALNTLELSALARKPDRSGVSRIDGKTITLNDIKRNLMQAHVLSEKDSDQSHHLYSALQKSIRAGKANASLYWLVRIMTAKEDPVNIARRLVRISSEDIGLADPDALGIAVHTMYGCQMIGMPECDVLLVQCTVYLARAPKSRLMYNALRAAERVISEHEAAQPAVPLHMRRDAADEKRHGDLGCVSDRAERSCSSTCLPEELQRADFFREK